MTTCVSVVLGVGENGGNLISTDKSTILTWVSFEVEGRVGRWGGGGGDG
jgi:hypothetical protein